MIHLLVLWFFTALGFVLAERLLGSSFKVSGGFGSVLLVAALFGILDALIGWVFFLLLGFATLGIGFLLAFVTWVIANAIVLKITDLLSSRLEIRGFLPAVWGAAIISLVTAVGHVLVR